MVKMIQLEEALKDHYVRRAARAIEAEDADALARVIPRHVIYEKPGMALEILGRAVNVASCETYRWVQQWLRNSDNDCLRARGDKRWQVMVLLEAVCEKSSVAEAV